MRTSSFFPPLPGEGGARNGREVGGETFRLLYALKRDHDGSHHPIEVLADLVVPESQHAEAFAMKDCIADPVMRRLPIGAVMVAIDFDDQSSREACEVQEVPAEG